MALNWGSVERLVVWFVDFLYHDVYSNKKKASKWLLQMFIA